MSGKLFDAVGAIHHFEGERFIAFDDLPVPPPLPDLSTFEKYILLGGINLARIQHDDKLCDELDGLWKKLTQEERARARNICPYLDTCDFETQDFAIPETDRQEYYPSPERDIITRAGEFAGSSPCLCEQEMGSCDRCKLLHEVIQWEGTYSGKPEVPPGGNPFQVSRDDSEPPTTVTVTIGNHCVIIAGSDFLVSGASKKPHWSATLRTLAEVDSPPAPRQSAEVTDAEIEGALAGLTQDGKIVAVTRDFFVRLCERARANTRAGVDGVQLIAAERARQISAEGWTPEHDDEHAGFEMTKAAVCYARFAADEDAHRDLHRDDDCLGMNLHPWPWALKWWKPSPGNASPDRVRELVKAGALIAAEIDRLQRAKP